MAGADLSRVGREEFVPAKEFQMRWCRAYLGGYRDLPEHKVNFVLSLLTFVSISHCLYFQITLSEVSSLHRLVQKFGLVFCLQEIVWALIRVSEEQVRKS